MEEGRGLGRGEAGKDGRGELRSVVRQVLCVFLEMRREGWLE